MSPPGQSSEEGTVLHSDDSVANLRRRKTESALSRLSSSTSSLMRSASQGHVEAALGPTPVSPTAPVLKRSLEVEDRSRGGGWGGSSGTAICPCTPVSATRQGQHSSQSFDFDPRLLGLLRPDSFSYSFLG